MMTSSREQGYVAPLLIPLIVAVVLLVSALSFGGWAFSSRQDYKNHSDKKATAASAVAVTKAQAADAIKYAEAAKNPLKTFVGPDAYGAVTVQYPKTWSAYIVTQGASTALDAYFHPDIVPYTGDSNNAYSLRVEILPNSYASVVAGFNGLVSGKKVAAEPYSLPKVPAVKGMRFTGQLNAKKQGSIIVLPVRNVTLEISTESNDYMPDFNNIILPNLSFSP
jgi:hypothetical protein